MLFLFFAPEVLQLVTLLRTFALSGKDMMVALRISVGDHIILRQLQVAMESRLCGNIARSRRKNRLRPQEVSVELTSPVASISGSDLVLHNHSPTELCQLYNLYYCETSLVELLFRTLFELCRIGPWLVPVSVCGDSVDSANAIIRPATSGPTDYSPNAFI